MYIVKGYKAIRCIAAHEVPEREQAPSDVAPGVRQLAQVPCKLCGDVDGMRRGQ